MDNKYYAHEIEVEIEIEFKTKAIVDVYSQNGTPSEKDKKFAEGYAQKFVDDMFQEAEVLLDEKATHASHRMILSGEERRTKVSAT